MVIFRVESKLYQNRNQGFNDDNNKRLKKFIIIFIRIYGENFPAIGVR